MECYVNESEWDNIKKSKYPTRTFVTCNCGHYSFIKMPSEKQLPYKMVVVCKCCNRKTTFLIDYGKYLLGTTHLLKKV